MMNKNRTLRIALSSALMLAVAAAGVTMYRSGSKSEGSIEKQAQEQTADRSEAAQGQEEAMGGEESTEPETADVTTEKAQAENTQALGQKEQQQPEETVTPEASATPSESSESSGEAETAAGASESETADGSSSQAETADTSAPVQPVLNFSEDSVMLWPVSGEVLIDYSMDATTYFPTLDQYKYHPALVLASAAGEPVQAAANGQVTSVFENEETGLTLTMDLGNGYQAVYGQLKDLTVESGQVVEAGTILGYVNDPTKYYVKEGPNLYFAMTKDGAAIDPMIYIETVTE